MGKWFIKKGLSSRRVYLLYYNIHLIFQFFIGLQFRRNLVDAVYNGSMILFPKEFSYVYIGSGGQVTAEVHDNLPGKDKFRVSFLGTDIFRPDAEMLGYHIDNQVGRNLP